MIVKALCNWTEHFPEGGGKVVRIGDIIEVPKSVGRKMLKQKWVKK